MRAQVPAKAHGLATDWPSRCQSAEQITFLAQVSSTSIIFHQNWSLLACYPHWSQERIPCCLVPVIPFSLLDIVGRLFEKILIPGILGKETECWLLPRKQFRFWQRYSMALQRFNSSKQWTGTFKRRGSQAWFSWMWLRSLTPYGLRVSLQVNHLELPSILGEKHNPVSIHRHFKLPSSQPCCIVIACRFHSRILFPILLCLYISTMHLASWWVEIALCRWHSHYSFVPVASTHRHSLKHWLWIWRNTISVSIRISRPHEASKTPS